MNFFRKILIFSMLAAALLSAKASAQPSLDTLQRTLRHEVEWLSNPIHEGRAFGSPSRFFSAAYTASHFSHAGLKPLNGNYFHSFECQGRTARNVMAYLPGKRTDRFVIVGTYADGLGRLSGRIYPGADSNGSGMAALISLADSIKAGTLSVIYVFFDGRNASMAGSRELWRQISSGELKTEEGLTIRPSQIEMMVNIDIIGSTLAPVHPRWLQYVIAMGPQEQYYNILLSNSRHQLGLRIEPDYYGSKDFTRLFYRKIGDQRVFLEHGIPCVVWTSGITDLTNKVEDKPSTLNYPIFAARVELIRRWLEEWIIR